MTGRALWVTPVSNLAGVSRHILDVVREGIPGFTVTVAAPSGPLLDELSTLGVDHVSLPLDGPPTRALARLRRVIAEVRPHVVHSHLARADFLVAPASVGMPCRLVSTEHGIAANAQLYNEGRAAAALRLRLHHVRTRRFNALIAVSESTREQMIRAWRPTTPITVILNGVDRTSQPAPGPGVRFLSLARLAKEKRIEEAIRAFAEIVEELPDATFTVAGEGPLRDDLVGLAASLGLADRVTFPGHVDAPDALRSHDVLVQLSAWENASYSVLDAVVNGLGVVATPVGGNPEILPEQCLSEADDVPRLRQLLLAQASDVSRRPSIPEEWPTVSEMTSQIADLYGKILVRDTHLKEGAQA